MDLDVREILSLKSRKARRTFIFYTGFVAIFSIIALLLLNHVSDFDEFKDITSEKIVAPFFEHLLAITLISLTYLAIASYVLKGEENHLAAFTSESAETKKLHERALSTTDFWYHNGHTASWVRTTVLPHLHKRSKKKERKLEVGMIILNPSNFQLCSDYFNYKSELQLPRNTIPDLSALDATLISAILTAQNFANLNSHGLRIELYLRDSFLYHREDISSTLAFITNIHPNRTALIYRNMETDDSCFYDTSLGNYNNVKKISKKVDLYDPNHLNLITPLMTDFPKSVDATNLKSYLQAKGITIVSTIDDNFISQLKQILLSADNLYK